MCDLFGMSCNASDRATRSLPLFREYGRFNRDGWGIGWFDGNAATVERFPNRADQNDRFAELIEEVRSHNVLAHVRWATHGYKCECNCHPFKHHYRGRDWLMAHNGVVNDAISHPMAEGDTDSEQIFFHIMDKVEEYQNREGIRGTYPALKLAIRQILRQYGPDINLNLLISDGNSLYVFHHHSDKPIYLIRRSKGYGGAAVVSTRELTGEDWEELEPDRLLVLDRGEVFVYSTPLI